MGHLLSENFNKPAKMKTQLSILEIEGLIKSYASLHQKLSSLVRSMEVEMVHVKNNHLPSIIRAANEASAQKVALHTAIQVSPNLFESPRTLTMHGIKVGFMKTKGSLTWDDEDKVVNNIHRKFGENAIAYLHTKESPDKDFLSVMPEKELQSLGITVNPPTDQVVIKAMDSEVEKIVSSLLKKATEGDSTGK